MLVSIDKDVMSGKPCVKGRRLPTKSIKDLFVAGCSIGEIAADYFLMTPREVEDALRYELMTPTQRRKAMGA